MEIGKRIKEYREKNKITQDMKAKRALILNEVFNQFYDNNYKTALALIDKLLED